MKTLWILLFVTSLSIGHAPQLEAQRAQPYGYTAPARTPPLVRIGFPRSVESHVAIGALAGAVLTIGGIVWYMNANDEELLGSPLALAPAMAAGAIVGGTIGYVVWRIRR